MREGLQLQYKIVRDKSIKEALLFAVFFSIFLAISLEVRCARPPLLPLAPRCDAYRVCIPCSCGMAMRLSYRTPPCRMRSSTRTRKSACPPLSPPPSSVRLTPSPVPSSHRSTYYFPVGSVNVPSDMWAWLENVMYPTLWADTW